MKKAWVVLGGREDSAEEIKHFAEEIKYYLSKEEGAEVVIVETHEELMKKIEEEPTPELIIYLSSLLLEKAREIRRKYPHAEVVVLAGVIPKGEVAVIPKGLFLFNGEGLGRLFNI